jgi:Uma2 family endonuclease
MIPPIISAPRTMMQVFDMLPEGTLAELINNHLYMSPSPKARHQRLLTQLVIKIGNHIESMNLGELYVAPFDVYLDNEQNAVQPDIIFVSTENSSIVDDDDVIHGVPDLIIEILSPGNPDHDKVIKKNLYEHFGVKEYWIIDPATKETTGYQWQNGSYRELKSLKGTIDSKLLKKVIEF